MLSAPNLSVALKTYFGALSRRRRRQGVLMLVLMLCGAAAEMLGISAVLLFLTLLTKPQRLTATPAWHRLEAVLNSHPDPVIVAAAGFVAVISGWVTTEVGRQPYTVYGQLLTSQSHSPLAAPAVAASLLGAGSRAGSGMS